MSFNPSIFNDVLSPITLGPSSSNTCGTFRIASLTLSLFGEMPTYLSIEMLKTGGFADSFYGMQSDKAFIAGIIGKDFLSYNLENAYNDAKAAGLVFDFSFTANKKIPETPSESALITLSNSNKATVFQVASLGGGDVIITKINDTPVYIDGRHDFEAEIDGAIYKSGCIYEVPVKDCNAPFTTCSQMLEYAHNTNKGLWQIALEYESTISGLSEAAIWETSKKIYDLTMESLKKGLADKVHFDGITTPKAKKVYSDSKSGKLIPLGAATNGSPYALAIMEYSNSHGKIVCMPTGGSSGIIPSCIESMAESMDLSYDDKIKAMLVAGLIGVFYYPTHYTGALGCQAEIGIAISMAAAGMSSLLSNDPKVSETAAVLGIQSVLGMLCDPIEGYVQVPCFIRNMTAVPTAMVCANSAVSGLDAVVSLDEMVQIVIKTGEKLRPINCMGTCSYKCIRNK